MTVFQENKTWKLKSLNNIYDDTFDLLMKIRNHLSEQNSPKIKIWFNQIIFYLYFKMFYSEMNK